MERWWRWTRAHRSSVLGWLTTGGLALRWLSHSRWVTVPVGVVLGGFVVCVCVVPLCVDVVRAFREGLADPALDAPPK